MARVDWAGGASWRWGDGEGGSPGGGGVRQSTEESGDEDNLFFENKSIVTFLWLREICTSIVYSKHIMNMSSL